MSTDSETGADEMAEAILASHRELQARREADELEEPSALEPFYRFIERHQVWLFVPLFVGLILWPIVGPHIGLTVTGGAIIAAGLVPVITGRYRTRVMRFKGMPARLRGLFSVGLGTVIILAAHSL